ncbi:MAG: hypothetical protein ACK56W_01880 [Pirellula sp.]|nr:hypothetical protein [Pirellula sp.]
MTTEIFYVDLWIVEKVTTSWNDSNPWSTVYPEGLNEGSLAEGEYVVSSDCQDQFFTKTVTTAFGPNQEVRILEDEFHDHFTRTEEYVNAYVDSIGDWYDRHLKLGERYLYITTQTVVTPSVYNQNTSTWSTPMFEGDHKLNYVTAERTYDAQNLCYTSSKLSLLSMHQHEAGGLLVIDVDKELTFRFDENAWGLEITQDATSIFYACDSDFDYVLPFTIQAVEFTASTIWNLVNKINNWPWKCIL